MTETTQPKKMPLTSMDIAEEKRELLKHCLAFEFPEIMAADKIDFDQLRRVLGEWIEPDRERFGLNWPGKAACMKVIQAPSVGTLKPEREESIDWDTTENLFIEGDNLEVLKLLQKAYFGKIKMIYIDPPYNTGKEFIYPDKYSETLDTYLEYTGQKDSNGRKFSTNTDSSGRFHSRWLNMMYPRLYLAKNLLRDDGLVLVSIDGHEFENLVHLLNGVFGEENQIGIFTWEKGRKNDSVFISDSVEYIVVFCKDRDALTALGPWREKKEGIADVLDRYQQLRSKYGDDHFNIERAMKKYYRDLDEEDPRRSMSHFNKSDGRGLYFGDNISSASTSIPDYDIIHPITKRPVKKPNRGWGCTEPVMIQRIADDRVEFGEDETTVPKKKSYLTEVDSSVKTPVIYRDGRAASKYLEAIFGTKIFDNPKDVDVLSEIFKYAGLNGDAIILDFFAGSGSTGEAVWRLNAEDGGKRKFIQVQLPERVEEDSPAQNRGLLTIADIAKERLRRVNSRYLKNQAAGFRVFRLDRSCFRQWDSGTDGGELDTLLERLEAHIEHLAPELPPAAILFELLLKDGFPLTVPVEQIELAGKEVASVAEGALLICLDKQLTQEVIDAMADLDPSRVICLDAGFQGNDQLKANAVQTFKARARNRETAIEFRTV